MDVPQQDTRVVVGPCVLSYPKLFTPEPKMGEEGAPLEFSAELLVYQSNPHMQEIYHKLAEVANRVSMAAFQKPVQQLSKQPLRSLAERQGSKEPGFFFSARSSARFPPKVYVGNPPQPCTDPEAFYAGAIVYVNLNCGAYDKGGNRGVKFFLNSILKVADGERLVPLRSGSDDFAEILGLLSQMPVAPPAQQFAPPAQQFAPPAQQFAPPAQQFAPPAQQFAPPVQQFAPPAQQFAMPPMPGFPQ
jgi:hypothetical protein